MKNTLLMEFKNFKNSNNQNQLLVRNWTWRSQVHFKCLLIIIPPSQSLISVADTGLFCPLSICCGSVEDGREDPCYLDIRLVSLVTILTMDQSNMILDFYRGWTLSISHGGWWDPRLSCLTLGDRCESFLSVANLSIGMPSKHKHIEDICRVT